MTLRLKLNLSHLYFYLRSPVRTLYWRAIKLKDQIYWPSVELKNRIYWSLYDSKHLSVLIDAVRRPKIYLQVVISSLRVIFRGKKLVLIYLLYRGHQSWVDGVVQKLAKDPKFGVIIFTHDAALPKSQGKNIKVFFLDSSKPFRGLNLLPAVFADLYLTPTSVTGNNAAFIYPKVHFFHSLVSVHFVYENDTFSDYQFIYCAGQHHIEEMKEWFADRNLKNKCLIPGGYPKLDSLLAKRSQLVKTRTDGIKNTVIFAPTLLSKKSEKFSALLVDGKQIIKLLLESGYQVTFRPHPLNLEKTDPYASLVEGLIEEFQSHARFTLDRSVDYFESYENSDLMITDISGTGFTYGLGFERPVVFVSPNEGEHSPQKGVEFLCRKDIGKVVEDVQCLPKVCREILDNFESYQKNLLEFRSKFIFNVGESDDYFMKNISYIITGKKHPDWTYID
ncbi:MAG: CDP-glycerol glycerophosphotransferase family protein [Pseudomonadota bacterium]|nr:CDP-glycerol glycerophosphotransferase family protein [Pseudomonadota bacterium]